MILPNLNRYPPDYNQRESQPVVVAVDLFSDVTREAARRLMPTPALIGYLHGVPKTLYYIVQVEDDGPIEDAESFVDPVTGDALIRQRVVEGSELDQFWATYRMWYDRVDGSV